MVDEYCIDASVVIDLHRSFPRDIYPSVWARVEDLIVAGRAVMPRQVLVELERVDDRCELWVKSFESFVAEAMSVEIDTVAMITQAHPEWVQNQANEADPWVVANAANYGRIIVTNQRLKGPNTVDADLKIPNIALEWTLSCSNFTDLARREGWVF